MGRNVERRAQASAKLFVIGPERERITILRAGSGIDQVELTGFGIIVEFLENPGFNLSPAVGEGDPVEVALNAEGATGAVDALFEAGGGGGVCSV